MSEAGSSPPVSARSSSSTTSTSSIAVIPLVEGESELAMAAAEEAVLRGLADDRTRHLLDPTKVAALSIFEAVERERGDDHGKPFVKPPPVLYSTEYWREWRSRVKVDSEGAETEAERREREKEAEGERRRRRPKLRAPPPAEVSRHGPKRRGGGADFSAPRYGEGHRHDPRHAAPKEGEGGEAFRQVQGMMKAFGVDTSHLAEAGGQANKAKRDTPKAARSLSDSERLSALPDASAQSLASSSPVSVSPPAGGRTQLRYPTSASVSSASSSALASPSLPPQFPPAAIKPSTSLRPLSPSKGPAFGTATRQDWAKVTSVSQSPTVQAGRGLTPATQYDLKRSEKFALPSHPAPSFSSRHPRSDVDRTPGPVYDPKLDAVSTRMQPRRVSMSGPPRFPPEPPELALRPGASETAPGPQTYCVEAADEQRRRAKPAMAFDGLRTFEPSADDLKPDTSEKPLRAMRSFGFGCDYQQHVLYGQCLDGLCSKRSGKEKFNMRKVEHWRARGAAIKGEETLGAHKTALHFAVIYDDLPLVSSLCLGGMDIDAQDEQGCTPLHAAATKGKNAILERLLNNAMFPGQKSRRIAPLLDVRDKDGNTALHLASIGAHRKCVELLIDAGADPDVLNDKKQTALDVAGTQSLFQALEYFSEMSKERARIESLQHKRRMAERQANEMTRAAERDMYKKSLAIKATISTELSHLSKRASALLSVGPDAQKQKMKTLNVNDRTLSSIGLLIEDSDESISSYDTKTRK